MSRREPKNPRDPEKDIPERLRLNIIPETALFPGRSIHITIANALLAEFWKRNSSFIAVLDEEMARIGIGILAQAEFLEEHKVGVKTHFTFKLYLKHRVKIADRRPVRDDRTSLNDEDAAATAVTDVAVAPRMWRQMAFQSLVFLMGDRFRSLRNGLENEFDALSDVIPHGAHYLEAVVAEGSKLQRELRLDPQRQTFGQLLDQITGYVYEQMFILGSAMGTSFFPEFYVAMRQLIATLSVEKRLRLLLAFADKTMEILELLRWHRLLAYRDSERDEHAEDGPVPVKRQHGNKSSNPLYECYQKIKGVLPAGVQKEIERDMALLLENDANSETDIKRFQRLEWRLWLPWGEYTKDREDFAEVERILNEDHAWLEQVKKRILEYLAVKCLNPAAKSPILCFVGPPGVGKTSLGRSIARALGREFVRMSLGGLPDEAEIRGHGYTFQESMPGQIIKKIRRAGNANPVFMLDEIDKVGTGWRSDPAAALLEVLDPEQNSAFEDRYIDLPFDLSRVLFITTANVTETMRSALLDRMEVIKLPGYTALEKLRIAKDHLIQKQRKEKGFPAALASGGTVDVSFTDEAIQTIIYRYTRDAGVRELERNIAAALGTVAFRVKKKIITDPGVIRITGENLHEYCGRVKFSEHDIPETLANGVVPVLAISSTGGFVFFVEVVIYHHPVERKIKVYGISESGASKELINKIEESAYNAFALFAKRGGILFNEVRELEEKFGPLFIHLNFTDGATSKDGTSAGVAIAMGLYLALSEKSLKPDSATPLVAFTGEISVTFDTLGEVGGIKEKLLAAHRAGIKKVIIPKKNEDDLVDIPDEIRSEIDVKALHSIWDVFLEILPHDKKLQKYIQEKQRNS